MVKLGLHFHGRRSRLGREDVHTFMQWQLVRGLEKKVLKQRERQEMRARACRWTYRSEHEVWRYFWNRMSMPESTHHGKPLKSYVDRMIWWGFVICHLRNQHNGFINKVTIMSEMENMLVPNVWVPTFQVTASLNYLTCQQWRPMLSSQYTTISPGNQLFYRSIALGLFAVKETEFILMGIGA